MSGNLRELIRRSSSTRCWINSRSEPRLLAKTRLTSSEKPLPTTALTAESTMTSVNIVRLQHENGRHSRHASLAQSVSDKHHRQPDKSHKHKKRQKSSC